MNSTALQDKSEISTKSMNIVGRVQLPLALDTSSLYIKCDEGVSINYHTHSIEVNFLKDKNISFNTFYNSFYEILYAKYTNISSLDYLLKLQGDFQISIYREFSDKEDKELVIANTFDNCNLSEYVKISLPHRNQEYQKGRIYLEIKCLSETGLFTEGLLVTEQEKSREVSLGIISCTFKKEAFIRKTINTVTQDKFLKDKRFKIFVVDNGKTLSQEEFQDTRVKLIPNKNLGGSGGFARGLVEALQEGGYTHFLFMDDDISLDSESIYRLFTLYEYANNDFAVSGCWLDLIKKHILYEAGALYGETNDARGCQPLSINPLRRNIELQNPKSLNFLLLEEDFDYGGFWFFSCSKHIVDKIGLLMPFFIQRDDIEFCLRIKNYTKNQMIIFPPISVWHEPSYAISKQPSWLIYYGWRNNMITSSIHYPIKYSDALKNILGSLLVELFSFNYSHAVMMVTAFEDYMKGSDFLKSSDAETLHSHILKASKKYESSTPCCENYTIEQFYQKPVGGSLKKIVSLLTLNGHLLPSFLISNNEAFLVSAPGRSREWLKAFANRKVILYKEDKNAFYEYELNQWTGIKIISRFLRVAITGWMKWSYINAEWRNASKELVSLPFWQRYFGLSK